MEFRIYGLYRRGLYMAEVTVDCSSCLVFLCTCVCVCVFVVVVFGFPWGFISGWFAQCS